VVEPLPPKVSPRCPSRSGSRPTSLHAVIVAMKRQNKTPGKRGAKRRMNCSCRGCPGNRFGGKENSPSDYPELLVIRPYAEPTTTLKGGTTRITDWTRIRHYAVPITSTTDKTVSKKLRRFNFLIRLRSELLLNFLDLRKWLDLEIVTAPVTSKSCRSTQKQCSCESSNEFHDCDSLNFHR